MKVTGVGAGRAQIGKRKPLCVALGLAYAMLPAAGQAGPAGPQVVAGSAVFSRPDARTLDVRNANGTVIHWQGFSIGQGERTRFFQPSAHSAVLNRVTGSDPSSILGQLWSNGRVFLVNPNGIVFGPTATVDTAALVASTLSISDADFAAGRLRFAGGAGGSIVNRGALRAGPDGQVVLIAPNIENRGVIEAAGGTLLLAAGRAVTLSSLDLEDIRFEVQAPADQVVNLGSLKADGGAISVFAGTLRHSGEMRADTIGRDAQGRITLMASKDIVLEAGSVVSASGAPGGVHHGGAVRIVAEGALDMRRGSTVRVDGGPDGGNGGFLELSGKARIALNGAFTGGAHAPGFRNGSLFIDPDYINIVSGGADTTGGDGVVNAQDNPAATLNIAPSALAGAWTNVSLAAINDITVASPLASSDVPAGGTLSLSAGNDVLVNAAIGSAGARFDHNLELSAARNVSINSPIHLAGNTLAVKAGGNVAASAVIDVGAGTARFDVGTGMTQSAALTAGVLELTGPGALFTLTNAANQVGTLKVNAGTVNFSNSTATVLSGLPRAVAGGETEIAPTSPTAGARFGDEISVRGNVMVIGAPDGQFGTNGRAYVYRWNGSSWVFEATLAPPAGFTAANFGKGAVVDGNHILVGAPETSDGDYRTGAVFAYQYNGSAWSAPTKLNFSQKTFESVFGYALALDSNRLVVGGPGRTAEGGFWTGKIWFFEFNTGTGLWEEKGRAVQSDWAANSNAYFGQRLDISGDRLIVGAWHSDASPVGARGSAYIFNFNPVTRVWTQSARLNSTSYDRRAEWFGYDVSISGDIAVAGAFTASPGGVSEAGSAYVFRYNGAAWVQEQMLKASDAAVQDRFGERVSVRNGIIAASSYLTDLPGATNAGAVYLFRNNGSTWVQDAKVTAATPGAGYALGWGMAFDGQRLFSGATGATVGGIAGAGSVFARNVSTAPSEARAAGGLTVNSGGSLTQSVPVTAGGAVSYGVNGAIALNGSISAASLALGSSGVMTLAGGSITVPDVTLTNGVLQGFGTVNGNVTNTGGTLRPGASPGTLVINGNYTQGPGGTLEIELGGTSQGVTYDLLSVTGTATLGGTMNVSLFGGYAPSTGNAFDVLTYASASGNFATINPPPGYALTGANLGTAYQIAVGGAPVPVPAAPSPTTLLPPEFAQVTIGAQAVQLQQNVDEVIAAANALESGEFSETFGRRRLMPVCR
ncbi:MAG: filamentous hemagglutinin N-terminal domain-containing protein [Burkholderiales bacterium]|nr:filamentous hemagglutinin N-terminal domain-containing protein [Burkholderiales bacterium]